MTKLDMCEFAPPLSEEIIRRAEKLSSANICDGMLGMGVPMDGCMDAAIMPVEMGMKVVGTACTVETADGDNLPIHVALYTAKPDYVMIIDGKAHADHPYFGDLMASTGKAVGLKGMIIDGYIRDRQTISEMGFPVFCRGYMQRGPKKADPGRINYPVFCGNVRVAPGDLIVADHDGVSVVPRDLVEAVLEKAEKKVAYERQRHEAIEEYERLRMGGLPLTDLTPAWVKEMLETE